MHNFLRSSTLVEVSEAVGEAREGGKLLIYV